MDPSSVSICNSPNRSSRSHTKRQQQIPTNMPQHPMASGGEYLSNISTYHDARSQSSARGNHATVMSPGQQSASQLSAALHRQIKSLKKENQQLKRQLDGRSVDKSPKGVQ
jgi:hypothetical protein